MKADPGSQQCDHCKQAGPDVVTFVILDKITMRQIDQYDAHNTGECAEKATEALREKYRNRRRAAR